MSKSVHVITNDPDQPRFKLTIKGKVNVIAAFAPERLSLGNILKGSTETRTVVVETERKGFSLTSVKSTNPAVTARVVTSDGKPAVEVTVKAGDAVKRLSGQIIATTNQKDLKELSLRLDGRISNDLAVDRERIVFVAGPDGSAKPVIIQVRSLTGKPFTISAVKDPSGAVSGTLASAKGAWIATLQLKDLKAGPNGVIQLMTDRDDQPVLEVRYTVSTRRVPPGAMRGKVPNISKRDGERIKRFNKKQKAVKKETR